MIVLVASGILAPEEIGVPSAVVIDDGKIREVWRDSDVADVRHRTENAQVIDLRPWRLAPGYIDLHTHGFLGHDVNTSDQAGIAAMAAALPSTGVSSFYPTIASAGVTQTQRQVQHITAATVSQDPLAAEILGIRLEGPFISRAKKGAQYEPAIRTPDPDELERLAGIGPIRMVDFAPEEDHEFRLLHALVRHGVVASIGHTMATFEQAMAALDAGARHCTHLFNAMPPLDHRAPGAPGAVLTDSRATVEMIADGIHLDPAILKLIVAAKGAQSVALVTDAMLAAGLPAGTYTFIEREVSVSGGAVRLSDGTLAGSILTLDRAVRNLVQLVGLPWSDAIRMATLTPATIAGVADRKGSLTAGADADLVVLDQHGNVQQTWRAGRLAFTADPRTAVVDAGGAACPD